MVTHIFYFLCYIFVTFYKKNTNFRMFRFVILFSFTSIIISQNYDLCNRKNTLYYLFIAILIFEHVPKKYTKK